MPTEARTDARVILLPGLGADGRLFDPQRAALPRLEVPSWLPPTDDESLAEYGLRMAAHVDQTEPFYLGGASFGGAVALEMARHLSPRAIFLIGSCDSRAAIAPGFRSIERVGRLLPAAWLKRGATLAVAAGLFGSLDANRRRDFADMIATIPAGFLRWGVHALATWAPDGAPAAPIHQIHGACDRLLPLGRVRATRVVTNAGHLLTWSHPDAVNSFLLEHMA